jgi:5'-3' exonuclease
MNKTLVIIDFSHMCSRMLHTAVFKTKPKKKNGKFLTEEWAPYMKHLIFNSLQFIKNKFHGEIVIAMDSKNNWRKGIYPPYKQHRVKSRNDSGINFEDYYAVIDKIGKALDELFPFKVIKIERAEADDIAGVLSYKFGNDRNVILITSDHDWEQVMAEVERVQMWDPIKKEYQELSDEEKVIIDTPHGPMSRFTVQHALIGDKGDNVLSITGNTEFSEPFKSFLKENEIYNNSVKEVTAMSIFDELLDKYDVYKITKSGKNKGKPTEEKDIFKTVPFGIKKAQAASESSDTLIELLDKHEMYKDRFYLNATLVDFMMIPEEMKEEIIQRYNNTEVHYDPNGILNYFMTENLGQMVSAVNKFYDGDYELKSSTSLDDFL